MTRRENFLRTLRREPHEYLPAAFVLDNMNFPGGFAGEFDPERAFVVEHGVGFQRRLGLDVLFRIAPSGLTETAAAGFYRADPAGGGA